MGKKIYAFLSALIIVALALGCMSTANAQEEKVIRLSDAGVFTGEVVGINKEDRALTLREPNGQVIELVVGEEARNFDQIVAGDRLKIEARNSVELYPEGSEGPKEERAGAVIERAPKGQKPAAAVLETVETTLTIKAIDRNARELIFELPGGNMITTKADNSVKAFDTLKVGDSFHARMSNSLEISVEEKP